MKNLFKKNEETSKEKVLLSEQRSTESRANALVQTLISDNPEENLKNKLYQAFSKEDEFGLALLDYEENASIALDIRSFVLSQIGVKPIIWDCESGDFEIPDQKDYLPVIIVKENALERLDLYTFLNMMRKVNILNNRLRVIFITTNGDGYRKAKMFLAGLKQVAKRRDNYTLGFEKHSKVDSGRSYYEKRYDKPWLPQTTQTTEEDTNEFTNRED